jgi:hypothetical protein
VILDRKKQLEYQVSFLFALLQGFQQGKFELQSINWSDYYTPAPPEGGYTVLPLSFRLSVLPSVPRYFSSHFSQQLLMAEIWYLVTSFIHCRYPISWEAFLDPSDSYFLFDDLVGFYTHWTYMRGYHMWALVLLLPNTE